jgi:hypothetical protein
VLEVLEAVVGLICVKTLDQPFRYSLSATLRWIACLNDQTRLNRAARRQQYRREMKRRMPDLTAA